MILSRDDIENIADGVIQDFRKVTGFVSIFTPIDQLATDYLKLSVTFEKLSSDSSLCGVTAYGDTNLKIVVDGITRIIKIKKNQIILDNDFIEMGKVHERCGKRRFTLAHEVAHQILFQMQSEEQKALYQKTYSTRYAHTIRQLKTAEDWSEWQANALGAALLMPRESVKLFMTCYDNALKTLFTYDLQDISEYTEHIIKFFSEYFHVSKTAAVIRLKQLGYMSEKNIFSGTVSYA